MQQNIHVIPRPPPQVGHSGSEQLRPVAFGRRAASIRYPSETPRLHLPVPLGRRGPSLYPIGEPNRPQQNSFDTFRPRIPRPATWSQSSYIKQNPSGNPSPIQRIPVEILGEIFTSFLQEPQAGPYFDAFSPSLKSIKYSKTNPIILGHICREWRAISISMPNLWSSIAIHIPRASWLSLIQLWLDRAANCPLALTLSQSENPVFAELEATNQILSLFLTRAHLWRHIEFEFSHGPPETALLNLPDTPLLESVHVNVGNWDPDSIDKFWCHIHSLPTLRKVDWDCLSRSRGLPVHAPWEQLTCINMPLMCGPAELEQLLRTLQQCQELVELTCDITTLEPPISELSITLPKLRRLKIIFNGELDPSSFMKHLTLPCLASFDIHQVFWSSAFRIRWLSDLLVRSACQLDKLSLIDLRLEEDEFLDFLSSPEAQHVVELRIRGRTFTDRAAEFFTLKKDGKAPFLPNLRF
ncbi:hypothetical protein Hypma_008579 [Hypsizygus marmoreus]|uniref:F-box domain-containing protein n=1 Tax=Hypsizygus marmoreus TaxID=39966 RepID=A0A369JUV4_HYPMA|nr:hypothetical protein Hypma_008579 [Hypsizygus marmoreus]